MNFFKSLGLGNLASTVASSPRVPRLVEWVPTERVVAERQPSTDGRTFVPGQTYFGVRLASLHLHDARRFTREVLPLCVCLAEFQQAGKRQLVPFALGPDTIRQQIRSSAGGSSADQQPRSGWVELRDILIVKPTPVSVANLQLFIGLYSIPGDDVARTLLNAMGTIAQVFGGTLSPAIGVAEKVYDGFGTLLGVDKVSPEVEALHGQVLKQSGYLLVASTPDVYFEKEKYFVSGGRLVVGGAPDAALATGFNYCLLAVERWDSILDATGVAPDLFGQQWAGIVDAFQRSPESAEAEFRQLQRQIYGSSELISSDRDALLSAYLVEYDKMKKILSPDDARATITHRSFGSDALTNNLSDFPILIDELFTPIAGQKENFDPNMIKDESFIVSRAAEWRKKISESADTKPGRLADAIIKAL